jgi:hypothetical protein
MTSAVVPRVNQVWVTFSYILTIESMVGGPISNIHYAGIALRYTSFADILNVRSAVFTSVYRIHTERK